MTAVRDGKQLFGDVTPQPASDNPNGFLALAVYDQPAKGGNGDGVIDAQDAIFSSLRLWIDADHDGVCRKEELYPLPALGVHSIALRYHLSKKRDQYGNIFRYMAFVNGVDPELSTVGHKVHDVILRHT
jgi:trimeric autotransporter adhesin